MNFISELKMGWYLDLKAILWKNAVLRRRHWFLTTIEIIVPTILFAIVSYSRSKVGGLGKISVNDSTYNQIENSQNIYTRLNFYDLNVVYCPGTEFTDDLIQKVKEKLQIPSDRK